MKKRNNLVELFRFIFSLLVVGFHIQFTFGDGVNFFASGSLAVEFFFLISGYFMAKSIEKIATQERYGVCKNSLKFMGGKIKGILPVHLIAIATMIVVVIVFDFANAGRVLFKGLPSIFLAQEVVVWSEAYADALIIPEWYLSAMLICMLIMILIALLLRKKLKGVFIPAVLLGVLGVIAVVLGFCMNWRITTTFVYNLRAWGEMCVGMFAYWLSVAIGKREISKSGCNALKFAEIICYCIPVVFGFVPMSSSLYPVGMVIAVICTFIALSITFSGKGNQIKNVAINRLFGLLGGLSLAIYLFHPVVLAVLNYAYADCTELLKYLIVFGTTLFFAAIYAGIRKLVAIKKRKNILNKQKMFA